LSRRSGASAERRHFEFGQQRSADAPLRNKKLPAPEYARPANTFAKFADECFRVVRVFRGWGIFRGFFVFRPIKSFDLGGRLCFAPVILG